MSAELLDEIKEAYYDLWLSIREGGVFKAAKAFPSQVIPSQADCIALYLLGATRTRHNIDSAWEEAAQLLLVEIIQ